MKEEGKKEDVEDRHAGGEYKSGSGDIVPAIERTVSHCYIKDRINGSRGGVGTSPKQGNTLKIQIASSLPKECLKHSKMGVLVTIKDTCFKRVILGKPEEYFYHFCLRLLNCLV